MQWPAGRALGVVSSDISGTPRLCTARQRSLLRGRPSAERGGELPRSLLRCAAEVQPRKAEVLLRPAFANSPIPFAPPEGATSISRSSSQKKRAPARKRPRHGWKAAAMAEVASDKSSAKAGTVLESRSAPEQSLSHLPQHRRCACRGLQQRAVRSGEGEQRGHDPPSMYQKPRRGFAATSSSRVSCLVVLCVAPV